MNSSPVVIRPATLRAEVVREAIELLAEAALYGGEREGPNASFAAAHTEPNRDRAHKAAELMRRAHLHGPLAAFAVLVRLGHWDADENLELHRCDVPIDFTREGLHEAARSALTDRRRERGVGRWWGRRVYAFADDAASGQAFSIRRTLAGFMVGIHFADPHRLIDLQGDLQQECAERGMTLDLPDRTVRWYRRPYGMPASSRTMGSRVSAGSP